MNTKGSKLLYKPYEGYIFLAPWLLGFLTFALWPMVQSVVLAFCDYDIFTPARFAGIDNFKEMFIEDKLFLKSLYLTTVYVLISVPVKLTAALLIAMLLNQKLRGMSIYRTIYYLPSIIGSGVAMAVTWKMVLSRDGYVNSVLGLLGLGPVDFLSSPNIALYTLSMLGAWQFGSSMVIFLAGLKQIPNELYEASEVDGASKKVMFIRITLPLLTPTILFNLIMGIINAFQVFTQIFVMTRGGPAESTYFYIFHLYKTAFENFRMGYSSALAWVLTIIIILFTAITFKTSNKWVYYES